KRLAGEPGFEPGLTESESAGLPLTYSPIRSSLGPAGAGHGPTAAIRRSFPIGGRLVTTFGLAIKTHLGARARNIVPAWQCLHWRRDPVGQGAFKVAEACAPGRGSEAGCRARSGPSSCRCLPSFRSSY